MPFQLSWYQDRRIQFLKLSGVISLDEFRQMNVESVQHASQGIPLVHTIVDLSEVQQYPRSLSAISNAIQQKSTTDHAGWTVFYGIQNSIMRFFVSVLTQASFSGVPRTRMVDSFQEAVDFLYHQDSSLRESINQHS